jgi:chromosome partitioning protein
MRLCIALVNMKPGVGKTTSAVWLSHAMAELGSVLLVDADPARSALEWAEMVGNQGFPFRVVGLPMRDVHDRIGSIARPDDLVVIDAPQLEDHAGIARSTLRCADEIVIPCAPTPIEVHRTTPMLQEIADANALRKTPARVSVLLTRSVAQANSTADARQALTELGYEVLRYPVPRLELYAQSFGGPVTAAGADLWRDIAGELMFRAGLAITGGVQS